MIIHMTVYILIGIALSMDAFSVAVCKGLSMSRLNVGKAVVIGLYFGIAQALMPVVGYFLGARFEGVVKAFNHWIAFILLLFIGGKMLVDALRGGENDSCSGSGVSFKEMFPMAIATSIDALAVGVVYALQGENIAIAAPVIGLTTFILSVAGVGVGCFFGSRWQKPAQIAGGCILIAIGIKILVEHLFFGG